MLSTDPRVEAEARHQEKALAVDATQMNLAPRTVGNDRGDPVGAHVDPDLVRQNIGGAERDDRQSLTASGQRVGDLVDRSIAAGGDDRVIAFADRVTCEALGIATARRFAHGDQASVARQIAQRAAEPRLVTARDRVVDDKDVATKMTGGGATLERVRRRARRKLGLGGSAQRAQIECRCGRAFTHSSPRSLPDRWHAGRADRARAVGVLPHPQPSYA